MNISPYIGLSIFLAAIFAFVFSTIFLSSLFGTKRPTREKIMPYECGVDPIGSTKIRFSVKFYLIAMLFIIFDIEIIFLYPWAIIFRDLGVFGLVEMFIFMILLFLGFLYVWKKGGLEWE